MYGGKYSDNSLSLLGASAVPLPTDADKSYGIPAIIISASSIVLTHKSLNAIFIPHKDNYITLIIKINQIIFNYLI